MSYDFMSKICNPGHSRLLFSISIKKKEDNKHELRCTSNQCLQLQILDSTNLQSDNCWFIKVNTKVNKVAPIVSWDRKRCIREVPESFANLQKCQSVCPQLGRQRHWQRALDNEAVLTGHWRVSCSSKDAFVLVHVDPSDQSSRCAITDASRTRVSSMSR